MAARERGRVENFKRQALGPFTAMQRYFFWSEPVCKNRWISLVPTEGDERKRKGGVGGWKSHAWVGEKPSVGGGGKASTHIPIKVLLSKPENLPCRLILTR